MSVLVNGVEMPKNGDTVVLRVFSDGKVWVEGAPPGFEAKAIELPPHFRLIDENDIKEWFDEWYDPKADLRVWQFFSELENVPTIAEAEE